MRSDEFDAFYAKGQEVYVGDMVRAGLDPEVARAKSDTDHQMLFPSGFDSPDQLLYVIEDDGAPAGFLWLCDRDRCMFLDRDGGRVIYLEGSYVNTFSGNPHPTPYYEYNQIMYRLDLSDPRLKLP